MNIVLLILYLFIIVFCFAFKKNKAGYYLAFLMAWILIAGNFNNADCGQYELRYESGMGVTVDIGFSFLCNTFYNLGFDYQAFKGIISFVCLLLVFRTIKKLSFHPAIGAAFFLIFPFIIDITQFRNFVSYSIVFSALPYLLDSKKSSLAKYVAIVLLASSVHTASLFYLVFALSKIKIKVWYVITIAIFVYLAKEAIKGYFLIQFDTQKLENLTQTSLLGAIAGSLVVILNYLLIWYVHKNYKKWKPAPVKMSQKALAFCSENTWIYCNMLVLLVIPFLFDNGNYSRIYRNIAVLNMIFMYNAYYLNKQKRYILMLCYYSYFVITTYLMGSYFSDIFAPVFYNNAFI